MIDPIMGIDISYWQENIDIDLLKNNDGVKFIILKAGGSDKGFYEDSRFSERYKQCKEAGMPVGCYYFVGKNCTDQIAGELDAVRFLNMIEGKQFEYPIFIDFEAPSALTRKGNTDAVIAFCDMCESQGYYVGVYASDVSGFVDRLELDRLNAYDKWVARYGNNPKLVKKYGIWQYTSSATLTGVSGRVDCDYAYKDYPTIMINHHLNGF